MHIDLDLSVLALEDQTAGDPVVLDDAGYPELLRGEVVFGGHDSLRVGDDVLDLVHHGLVLLQLLVSRSVLKVGESLVEGFGEDFFLLGQDDLLALQLCAGDLLALKTLDFLVALLGLILFKLSDLRSRIGEDPVGFRFCVRLDLGNLFLCGLEDLLSDVC